MTKITINLLKSIVYRIVMYLFDSTLVLILTGDFILAFTGAIPLQLIQVGIYFIFETTWKEIHNRVEEWNKTE